MKIPSVARINDYKIIILDETVQDSILPDYVNDYEFVAAGISFDINLYNEDAENLALPEDEREYDLVTHFIPNMLLLDAFKIEDNEDVDSDY